MRWHLIIVFACLMCLGYVLGPSFAEGSGPMNGNNSKHNASMLGKTIYSPLMPNDTPGNQSSNLATTTSEGRIAITLNASTYKISKNTSGYDVIDMEGFSNRVVTGDPMLPQKNFDVLLPPNADVSSIQLRIISTKAMVLDGTYNIKPSPQWLPQDKNLNNTYAYPKTSGLVINKSIYEANANYPETFVELLPYSQMRKWLYVPVNFIPFQYNPVTKKLTLNEIVTIEISYILKPSVSAADASLLSDTVFDDLAPGKFINYKQERDSYFVLNKSTLAPNTDLYDYVIITTNAIQTGSSKLNSFIAHKQSLGHHVLVVTETDFGGLTGQAPNNRAEKIRQWLINNYHIKEILYVLLIGNPRPYENGEGNIPMKMCWPRHGDGSYEECPTDYFYADLTGNWDINGNGYYGEWADYTTTGGVDLSADVYVGRIPAYGADYAALDSILQKIINYETSISTAWRKSALLPMSFSDSSTDGAYLAEQMKNAYLTPNGYSYWRMYQHGTSGSCTLNSVKTSEENLRGTPNTPNVPNRWAANDFGLVTWWGHGNSQGAYVGYGSCGDGAIMETVNAPSLDNGHPAHTYQCSCLNGEPEDTTNLQYSILKNGGITTTGATRVSWYYVGENTFAGSNSNAGMGFEYMKRLVQEMHAGDALYEMKRSGVAAPFADALLMNFYDICLYGDPSVGLKNPISAPMITNSVGATAITISSARLNGELTSTGGQNPTVHLYWGTTDGGTDQASWQHDENLGTKSVGTFYRDISGLNGETRYYYRCYSSNSAGSDWSDSTAIFDTLSQGKLVGAGDASCDTSAGSANFHLCRFQAVGSGDVDTIKLKASGSGNVKVAIYADNSGSPGALLTTASGGASVTAGWNNIAVPSLPVTNGAYYWLAFDSDIPLVCLKVSPGLIYWKAATYSTFTFPSQAGSGFSQTGVYTGLMAGWNDSSSQGKLVGAGDASCDTSAGPGNFHLCKFQAVGSGVVDKIMLKASGSGNVKVAIYADSSGAPGALLTAASGGSSVTAGWNNIAAPSLPVTDGAYYWLAFDSDVPLVCLKVSPGLIYWKAATYSTFTFPSQAGSGFSQTGVYTGLMAGWNVSSSQGKLVGADDASCDTSAGPGNFHLCKFQAVGSGVVDKIMLKASGSGNVKVAIYADNSGSPGALLTTASGGSSVNAGWNNIAVPSLPVTNGAYYWLAFDSDVPLVCLKVSSGLIYWKAATYSTFTFPSQAGSGFSQTGVYTGLMAGWNVSSSQGKLVGADDASCDTSAGPGNFHLCKFQAVGSGVVDKIMLKASGNGNVKVAIYADNSGSPGALLTAASGGSSVTAGWNNIAVPSLPVTDGAYYWLAFDSDIPLVCLKVSPGLIYWKAATYSTFTFPSQAGSGFSQTGVYTGLMAGWDAASSQARLVGADNDLCNSCARKQGT